MKENDFKLMISVLKQHYEMGYSQDEIAKREFISKSTVSRLIKKAAELGHIEVKINYEGKSVQGLQQKFFDEFAVNCVILPSFVDEYLLRLNDVCAVVAKDLVSLIKEDEIVGVTWGRTTECLANNLIPPKHEINGIKVCMLSGFVTGTIASMKATHIIEKFVEVFSAKGYVMPAPLLVDSEESARVFLADSNIRYVRDLCVAAETVILTIGGQDLSKSLLTDYNSYCLSMYNSMQSRDAAGDIAGRSFDINGNEIPSTISNRIISLPLEEIKKKRQRIGIAVGENKSRAILGALRGKIVNRLYTDEITAKKVLSEIGK
jgi:deoxyribonucleoside regulator